MTRRIGSILLIEREPDSKCELCGTVAETRPYGPNGERICFKCGMKNKKVTEDRYDKLVLGIKKQKN